MQGLFSWWDTAVEVFTELLLQLWTDSDNFHCLNLGFISQFFPELFMAVCLLNPQIVFFLP